jgi:hypothetical protein
MGYEDYETDELKWDLRRFYAVYVSKFLVRFDDARESKDFPQMLKQIQWLFSTVKGKVKKKYPKEMFTEQEKKIITIANKYPQAWRGDKFESRAVTDLEEAFIELYENLFDAMVQSGIFGKSEDLRGL